MLSGEWGGAEERAAHLLLRHLSPKQRESYLGKGEFVVRGSKRGRYVLTHDAKAVRWLPLWPLFPSLRIPGCLHAYGLSLRTFGNGSFVQYEHMPSGDRLLAMKLLLETDEKRFRAETNW